MDENLPVSLARWLREQGHQADHTSTVALNAVADGEIVRHAKRTGAVIVTKDNDYLTLSRGGPQVVHLRVGNLSSARLLELCARIWPNVVSLLKGGEPVVQVGSV